MEGRILIDLTHFVTVPISDANKSDFRDGGPDKFYFESTIFCPENSQTKF